VRGELILLRIRSISHVIQVEFPANSTTFRIREEVAQYVWEWFDLGRDLRSFYQIAQQDKVLQSIVLKYDGLRIIGIPDLFEALTWAIIGQQINLTFAYTLKKRFVEHFGESLTFEGDNFWVFPSPEKIVSINVDELRDLQFATRKAEYIIGIAKAITDGKLTKEMLQQKEDYEQMKKLLIEFRGVGEWTADYVIMKCLQDPVAFPIADVGLHNGLKYQLALERKPTIEEIKELATNWDGWQAYATFYLWRSLYE
jgi:DNA-3-methyladenine glycosylase II